VDDHGQEVFAAMILMLAITLGMLLVICMLTPV
jgi:hypothetical protein